MKTFRNTFMSSLLSLLPVIAMVRADDKVTIQFDRISERVLIVKTGFNYFDQVVAIASTKGLVIIDTGISPSITAEYKKIIEREFSRNDFAYVINTHYHSDHTFGNQVFTDAVIIGHDRTIIGLQEEEKEIPDKIIARRTRVAEFENQLFNLNPDSDQAKQLRCSIYFMCSACDDLEGHFVLTLPSVTFSDRMTLDLGDLTLKLIYFGRGRHTDSDIVAVLPEERLLFSGDLIFPFETKPSDSQDLDLVRWIDVLKEVLKEENRVKKVVTGHFGILPRERLTTSLEEFLKLEKDKY